jgi:hypothetical protein
MKTAEEATSSATRQRSTMLPVARRSGPGAQPPSGPPSGVSTSRAPSAAQELFVEGGDFDCAATEKMLWSGAGGSD